MTHRLDELVMRLVLVEQARVQAEAERDSLLSALHGRRFKFTTLGHFRYYTQRGDGNEFANRSEGVRAVIRCEVKDAFIGLTWGGEVQPGTYLLIGVQHLEYAIAVKDLDSIEEVEVPLPTLS